MPAKPLWSEQVSDVLVTEMIVRVAFQDRNAPVELSPCCARTAGACWTDEVPTLERSLFLP